MLMICCLMKLIYNERYQKRGRIYKPVNPSLFVIIVNFFFSLFIQINSIYSLGDTGQYFVRNCFCPGS